MFAHHAYYGVGNQFACASLIHSGSYGKHAGEEENGYPVDTCISFFFFQAAGDDAENSAGYSGSLKRNGLEVQSHSSNYAQKNEAGNPHLCLALRSIVIACACFFLSCFYSISIHSACTLDRNGLAANGQHVSKNDDGQRNADEGEFEESEGRKTGSGQSAGNDNVWRSTDHGDGAAYVSSDCQRHQFLGSRNVSCLGNTDNNRHEACYGTGIGRYRRQDDGYQHNGTHQFDFTGTCFVYYPQANCFCQACFKHSGADNEHTTEKNDGGVGKTCINLFGRKNAKNTEGCAGCHCSDCQRDQFGNKQECCYCQYTQCSNGWIHKVHLPFDFSTLFSFTGAYEEIRTELSGKS